MRQSGTQAKQGGPGPGSRRSSTPQRMPTNGKSNTAIPRSGELHGSARAHAYCGIGTCVCALPRVCAYVPWMTLAVLAATSILLQHQDGSEHLETAKHPSSRSHRAPPSSHRELLRVRRVCFVSTQAARLVLLDGPGVRFQLEPSRFLVRRLALCLATNAQHNVVIYSAGL